MFLLFFFREKHRKNSSKIQPAFFTSKNAKQSSRGTRLGSQNRPELTSGGPKISKIMQKSRVLTVPFFFHFLRRKKSFWDSRKSPGCSSGPFCRLCLGKGGLVRWLAGWLAGWFAGWLVGWLAGWLFDWLAGWLAGWLLVSITQAMTGQPPPRSISSRRFCCFYYKRYDRSTAPPQHFNLPLLQHG